MIWLLRNKVRDSGWHAVDVQGVYGFGFGDGLPILPTNFKPDLINASVDARECNQHMDVRYCRLVSRGGGNDYELISCHKNRDERIMLVTDLFDITLPNVEIVEHDVDIFCYPATLVMRGDRRFHRRGHTVIRFHKPDSYVSVRISRDGRPSIAYAYSGEYGHLHIGNDEQFEQFKMNPVAFFEEKVPEANRFDAVRARHNKRKRLAKRFRRIVTGRKLPTDCMFAFGVDAVTVFLGGKKFTFDYHESAINPFRKCVDKIDVIYSTNIEPVLRHGGALCEEIVSGQLYCHVS